MGRKTGTLLAAVPGSGIVFLDTTVVTVTLPEIGRTRPGRYVGVLEGQASVYTGSRLSESARVVLAGAPVARVRSPDPRRLRQCHLAPASGAARDGGGGGAQG